jgi:hypothetical protein
MPVGASSNSSLTSEPDWGCGKNLSTHTRRERRSKEITYSTTISKESQKLEQKPLQSEQVYLVFHEQQAQ